MRRVVIAGGGLAAQRCAATLRREGFNGTVTIVCAEHEPPYDRPPLSKGYLAGEHDEDALALQPADWYAEQEIELLLGARAEALEYSERKLLLEDGRRLDWDALVIATGSVARQLPMLGGFDNVHSLRTMADARNLAAALQPGAHLAVIGAGFIGLEAAATARGLGLDVTVVEALPQPLAHILGPDVGRRFTTLHEDAGIGFRLGARLDAAHGNGSVEQLELADGERLESDVVLVGVGVAPASAWADGPGRDWSAGIPTDGAGRTALPDVYAAGDVALAYDERLGGHARTEHWDAATRQGTDVARAILGLEPGPSAMPSFWSDQHGSRIRYIGYAGEADECRVDAADDEPAFHATYLREGRPVAALVLDRPRELARLRREIDAATAPQVNPEEQNKESP